VTAPWLTLIERGVNLYSLPETATVAAGRPARFPAVAIGVRTAAVAATRPMQVSAIEWRFTADPPCTLDLNVPFGGMKGSSTGTFREQGQRT
jgi:hypothetical protein